MNTKTYTVMKDFFGWIPMLSLLFVLAQNASAETFELRMAVESVPGAKDVERGDIDQGIRRLQRALDESQFPRSAVATDLCAAYIMQRELESAERWCDEAIKEGPYDGAALNNRGVLRTLQGQYEAAVEDFNEATKLDHYKVGTSSGPSEQTNQGYRYASRQIAGRNLAIAAERWAAAKQENEAERVAAEQ